MLSIVKRFSDYCEKNERMSSNTIKAYGRDMTLFVAYFELNEVNCKTKLNEITLDKLYDFQKKYSNKSASTVARLTACVKSFYKFLDMVDYISKNIAIYLKAPKIPKRLPKYLNNKESVTLLNQVNKMNTRSPERDYCMLSIFLYTGIRVSELVNIDIPDIKDGYLTVIGKGNKERRIPLNKECQDAVNRYLAVKKNHCGCALFVSERNNRMQSDPTSLIVKKYLKAIGKGDLSTHKLRASAATRWYKNGADVLAIQELLGHESLETTKLYTHIDNDIMQNVIDNDVLE